MTDGFLNIYKEKGYTSHDVVAVVRRTLHCKAGHTGTLDPMAEGVLPICLGKATRLADTVMSGVKAYRAHIVFGATTDTQDSTGEVLERRPVSVSRAEIEDCIRSFVGPYDQAPPMYSAVKVNGKRLYALAREGIVIERATRRVEIFAIDTAFVSDTEAVIDVSCSKGTYIRTLCADIGEKLGCGAHMSALLRTRSGGFSIESAMRLEELASLAAQGRAEECVIPIASVLADSRAVTVKPTAEKFLQNGNKLRLDQVSGPKPTHGEKVLVYDGDRLAAIYQYVEDEKVLKCECML